MKAKNVQELTEKIGEEGGLNIHPVPGWGDAKVNSTFDEYIKGHPNFRKILTAIILIGFLSFVIVYAKVILYDNRKHDVRTDSMQTVRVSPTPSVDVTAYNNPGLPPLYSEQECPTFKSIDKALRSPSGVCELNLGTIEDSSLTTLSDSILLFQNIKILNVWNSDFTVLPEIITNLATLEELDLGGGRLTSLPNTITKLSNLKRLSLFSTKPGAQYIRGNYLTRLPDNFGELNQLEYLNLNENGITRLPSSFWNLTQLRYLDLSGNPLSELSSNIRQLKSIEYLQLAESNISELPETIGELSNLKQLDIAKYSLDSSTTRITYPNTINRLPSSIGRLENLEILNLSNLSIKTLPQEIKNLKKLRKLDLINTKVSKEEVQELRQSLPNCLIEYYP